jgi:hypothetical protein
VARPQGEDDSLVDTFIIYQDDDSSLKQVWTDDGKTWQKSSPEAFQHADAGTDITCVTLAVWEGSDIVEAARMLPANHMARCYFRRGGQVVEARLRGTDWFDNGPLPLL